MDSFWKRRIDLESSWSFVKCRHIYAVSSLMDTAYWMSEHSDNPFGAHYHELSIASVVSANVMNRSIGIDIPVLVISYHWTNEYFVISDSDDSTVTYTAVSSSFEGLSDIGSPGVDEPPIMPEDPYAYVVTAFHAPPLPDYVPSPEEPQAPPLPDFVSKPVYPEFMPPEDEVFLAEEQPLLTAVSPTDQSPGYVPKSDPKEDPKDDDEDPKEDPADYPTDRDDDDDDEEEEEEPSEDDDDEDEEDEDEEEEHPAPANSVPPPPVHRVTARMSIRAKTVISHLPREEVERLLAIPTLPPSPLTPLSSPLPQIPSPPLPVPPPVPVLSPPPPASLTHPLGYRAAMIRLRAEAPSTS
ncbi:hypothetical protein Tco_1311969 [Tanacetum coccineum]